MDGARKCVLGYAALHAMQQDVEIFNPVASEKGYVGTKRI